jgi:hypothetical protein
MTERPFKNKEKRPEYHGNSAGAKASKAMKKYPNIISISCPYEAKTAMKTPNERSCKKGHTYVKSSDCPTCPTCEKERLSQSSVFETLTAPARRALEHHDIHRPEDLCAYREKEILSWHGMGPSSIPKLKAILQKAGLHFKEN